MTGYTETDIRAINDFRQAIARELDRRLADRMIKFVAVMLAAGERSGRFKLFVRGKHMLTNEGAELQTKVTLAQMRTRSHLERIADGIVNEMGHYFHGKDVVIELQEPAATAPTAPPPVDPAVAGDEVVFFEAPFAIIKSYGEFSGYGYNCYLQDKEDPEKFTKLNDLMTFFTSFEGAKKWLDDYRSTH